MSENDSTNSDGSDADAPEGWSKVSESLRETVDGFHDELASLEREAFGSPVVSRREWRENAIRRDTLESVVESRVSALLEADSSPDCADRLRQLTDSGDSGNADGGDGDSSASGGTLEDVNPMFQ